MPATAPKSTIYFFSGLGADWRMFQFLDLPDGQRYVHIQWLPPETLDEPIQQYVHRIRQQIKDPNPIFIGLSFGGVVAIEMAKLLPPKKLIIISSLATHHGLPNYYRFLGELRLHRILPFRLMKSVHPLGPWFFGAHSTFEKKLLKEVITEIDERFLRWSLGQLLAWRQQDPYPGLVHLHGTKDKVLPIQNRKEMIRVEGGEHLMVLHQAAEISSILRKILEDDHDR